jgi:hypothetical protein
MLHRSQFVPTFWRNVRKTSMNPERKRTPILLLPFVIVWALFSFVMKLTGRLLAAILGFVLVAVGLLLTLSLFAAPIGIPLLIFGFLLMLRSVF